MPGQGRSQLQASAILWFPVHHVCLLWYLLSYPGHLALPSASVLFKTPGLLKRMGAWELELFPVERPRLASVPTKTLEKPWSCRRFAVCVTNITAPASPGNERGVTN